MDSWASSPVWNIYVLLYMTLRCYFRVVPWMRSRRALHGKQLTLTAPLHALAPYLKCSYLRMLIWWRLLVVFCGSPFLFYEGWPSVTAEPLYVITPSACPPSDIVLASKGLCSVLVQRKSCEYSRSFVERQVGCVSTALMTGHFACWLDVQRIDSRVCRLETELSPSLGLSSVCGSTHERLWSDRIILLSLLSFLSLHRNVPEVFCKYDCSRHETIARYPSPYTLSLLPAALSDGVLAGILGVCRSI